MTVERTVRVRGRGRVEVAAYGLADAEHLVEKELGRLWPEARVWVTEVARAGGAARIVEEFTVSYGLEADVAVPAESPDEAPGAAFRHARSLVAGSRYARTEWATARGPRPGGEGA
ncbi:MAG TPA: hypothetical protein VFL93_06480 [Longimicrobiaceae bacterium]|nr:hypothetical protein [Longimicrobiaceae bacterium]